jgi:hypothetical protein
MNRGECGREMGVEEGGRDKRGGKEIDRCPLTCSLDFRPLAGIELSSLQLR